MGLTWEKDGPRKDERELAGKVAGVLWLLVLPMVWVGMLLPGSVTAHWTILAAITVPALGWGAACLVIPWERVKTPLLFHLPAALALLFIGALVAFGGIAQSPLVLTFLMLIAFCAYFFTPRAAVMYIACCPIVQALPLIYEPSSLQSGLLAEIWVAIFVYAAVGGVVMIGKRQLLALRDIAQDLSLHDSLTGVANRRALTDIFENHAIENGRSDSLGLAIVDLDDFKEANTLYGLPGGDRVLRTVADVLCSLARPVDTVVRLGGDEFALVAPGITSHGMQRFADRAVAGVRDAGVGIDLPGFNLSASAGWALYPDHGDSVDELMTVADMSLRAAKINGKDRSHAPVDWTRETVS
jgi:diguanylate cyclase (GGDEF)-like protein